MVEQTQNTEIKDTDDKIENSPIPPKDEIKENKIFNDDFSDNNSLETKPDEIPSSESEQYTKPSGEVGLVQDKTVDASNNNKSLEIKETLLEGESHGTRSGAIVTSPCNPIGKLSQDTYDKKSKETLIYDECSKKNINKLVSELPTYDEIKALEEKLKSLKAEKYKKIDLVKTDIEGVKVGIRKDGKKYSVRDDRGRFFYPSEWMKFFDALNERQKFTFRFLINTGCRINEARHVRVGDIDLDNKRILVRITKVKAKKGEKNHKPRTIPISSQFAKYLRWVFRENNLTNECYLASSNDPKKDEMSENPKLFKYGILSNPGGHLALKKNLKKSGIKDWYNFSLHNIRKSLETWFVALNVDGMKITAHIGHDLKTAAQHYVSADVFSFEEKKQMRLIIGDLYQQQF